MSIAEMRREAHMSQREFADYFGIPVRTLQQWEQGKSKPADYVVSMMEKLAPLKRCEPERTHLKPRTIPPRHCWRVCIGRPFPNCNRIYPIQQRKVRALLDELAINPTVKRVIVFGSSTTERCHIGSDVDIYVEQKGTGKLLERSYDFAYDLWTEDMVDDRLRNEILAKGVTVYG